MPNKRDHDSVRVQRGSLLRACVALAEMMIRYDKSERRAARAYSGAFAYFGRLVQVLEETIEAIVCGKVSRDERWWKE